MSTKDERLALLRVRIADANLLLQQAEEDVEQAVSELSPVLAGDKRMSTEALDRAFQRVRGARKSLTDLEGLLASEQDSAVP